MHPEFEELCALAAMGQLHEQEDEALIAHLNGCEACRCTLEDFRRISAEVLLPAGDCRQKKVPGGMRRRFLLRMEAEGMAAPRLSAASLWPLRWVHTAGMALGIVVLLALAWQSRPSREAAPRPEAAATAVRAAARPAEASVAQTSLRPISVKIRPHLHPGRRFGVSGLTKGWRDGERPDPLGFQELSLRTTFLPKAPRFVAALDDPLAGIGGFRPEPLELHFELLAAESSASSPPHSANWGGFRFHRSGGASGTDPR